MFANSEVEVAAPVIAAAGRLKVSGKFETQMGLRGRSQIRGTTEQPRYFCSNSVEYFARGVPCGRAFGIRWKHWQSSLPFIGQVTGLHAIDLIGEIGVLPVVGGEEFAPTSMRC